MRNVMIADWIRLCDLLDDDPELVSSVQVAAADGEDLWDALIDGLDDAGALAYLDEEDSGVELVDALAGVPRVFRAGADLEPVADLEGDLATAIVSADRILAEHGLRIVYLEEDSDARPLVVVPVANAQEIVSTTKRLGHEARIF